MVLITYEAKDPHGRGVVRGSGQAHGAPCGLTRDAHRGQVKVNYYYYYL